MKVTILSRLVCVFAVAFLLGSRGLAAAQAPDTILEWNRILLTTLGTPGATEPTVFFTRSLALMHVAIFDALNSFDTQYLPYAERVSVPAGASRDAAVAQAAHDTLLEMFPSQAPRYAAALASQLTRIPEAAARDGARVGATVARAILELRRHDGWNRQPGPLLLPSVPGYWKPVPPANAAAQFGHYADVVPFVISNVRAFLPEPPPALTSERYAQDFNEAKALGSATSTVRTADQTLVARLYSVIPTVTTTGIPAVWNNLTRDLIRAHGLNDIEAARLYALVNTTFHDSLYVSFSAKYLYGLWRPVTAIREAASDGNPATEPDPGFLALVPSPPYPTYPGNYACLAGAIAQTLTRYFGRDDVGFSITWAEPSGPGITRSYNGFRQVADEAARSRVYGGIHFSFDTTSSFGVCIPLGDYVFENTFRPRQAQ